MSYPRHRPRRLRRTAALRRMTAETIVSVDDLIAPMFVRDDISEPQTIASLPGVLQHTVTSLVTEAKRLSALGVPAICLFGVTNNKDAVGSQASDANGIVQFAITALKDALGDEMVVIADLCLDEYTDHGHCGVLDERGVVKNDETLLRYQEIAIAQARAGVDIVAPSGMMDGQVGAIRDALDDAGFIEVGILAYAAKYASSLYGPFRDAVNVELSFGDRRSYQQDPANVRESLFEVELDLEEGADMVMIKPALAYLDVLAAVAATSPVPVAAYQVSGEYAMIVAAADRNMIDRDAVVMETLTSIKRAGADLILTYFAGEVAEKLAAPRR